MKLLLPILLLFGLSLGFLPAEDFVERFKALKKAGDDAAIVALLEQASTEEVENPDYYANAGNYWWSAGGAVAITPIREGEFQLDPESLAIIDPKTGKKVGSVGKAGSISPEIPKRAIRILSDGAKKFPGRADIALGLAHVQKELGMKEASIETLCALLDHAKEKPETLRWTQGGELPKPAKTFLPETVQEYSSALFREDTPATDKLCLRLLDAVIKAFPDHPFAYNLKGAMADATGRPEEALAMLELAHEKAPEDSLILANVARAHVKLGQKKKALAIFEAALKLDMDPRSRARAEAELKKLKEAGDEPKAEPSEK